MSDIQEVYKEDTIGRRYHTPIISKKGGTFKEPKPETPITVNVKSPISLEEFRKLTDSLKIIYIKSLREQYGATSTQIAEMLGYSPSHFSKIVSKLGLVGLFSRGGRLSKKQKSEWNKFLKSGEINRQEHVVTKQILKKEESPAAMFCNCSFKLKGELKVEDITNKIRAMVSDGTPCSISISIHAIEDLEVNNHE